MFVVFNHFNLSNIISGCRNVSRLNDVALRKTVFSAISEKDFPHISLLFSVFRGHVRFIKERERSFLPFSPKKERKNL